MIQIAAFWKKESQKNPGRTYYTGKMGNGKLLLFRNEKKSDPRQPDLLLFVVESPKGDNGGEEKRQPTGEDDISF